jgi:hypothetical protein
VALVSSHRIMTVLVIATLCGCRRVPAGPSHASIFDSMSSDAAIPVDACNKAGFCWSYPLPMSENLNAVWALSLGCRWRGVLPPD